MKDLIDRQAAIEAVRVGALSTATLYGRTEEGETARKEIERVIKALPSIVTEKSLDKAKSEIRRGESKAYNVDFTMGCEYAISVIERICEYVVDESVDEKIESVDERRDKEEAIKEKIEAEERGF